MRVYTRMGSVVCLEGAWYCVKQHCKVFSLLTPKVSLQVDAAHLCYLVAGLTPSFWEPGARMCVLGADHRAAPRSCASAAALQRTEVLEWAKLPGTPAAAPVVTCLIGSLAVCRLIAHFLSCHVQPIIASLHWCPRPPLPGCAGHD